MYVVGSKNLFCFSVGNKILSSCYCRESSLYTVDKSYNFRVIITVWHVIWFYCVANYIKVQSEPDFSQQCNQVSLFYDFHKNANTSSKKSFRVLQFRKACLKPRRNSLWFVFVRIPNLAFALEETASFLHVTLSGLMQF